MAVSPPSAAPVALQLPRKLWRIALVAARRLRRSRPAGARFSVDNASLTGVPEGKVSPCMLALLAQRSHDAACPLRPQTPRPSAARARALLQPFSLLAWGLGFGYWGF